MQGGSENFYTSILRLHEAFCRQRIDITPMRCNATGNQLIQRTYPFRPLIEKLSILMVNF